MLAGLYLGFAETAKQQGPRSQKVAWNCLHDWEVKHAVFATHCYAEWFQV